MKIFVLWLYLSKSRASVYCVIEVDHDRKRNRKFPLAEGWSVWNLYSHFNRNMLFRSPYIQLGWYQSLQTSQRLYWRLSNADVFWLGISFPPPPTGQTRPSCTSQWLHLISLQFAPKYPHSSLFSQPLTSANVCVAPLYSWIKSACFLLNVWIR